MKNKIVSVFSVLVKVVGGFFILGSIVSSTSFAGFVEGIPLLMIGLFLLLASYIPIKNEWLKYGLMVLMFIGVELLTEAILPRVPIPIISGQEPQEVYEAEYEIAFEVKYPENLQRLEVNSKDIDENFRTEVISLQEGENIIEVVAFSEDGRNRLDEVRVVYVTPEMLQDRQEEKERQEEFDAKKQQEAENKAFESATTNNREALVCAQVEVESMLRNPNSADFPAVMVKNGAVGLGGDKYMVSSYVDAENGFGGTVRTYFTCTVQYNDEYDSCSTVCEFD